MTGWNKGSGWNHQDLEGEIFKFDNGYGNKSNYPVFCRLILPTQTDNSLKFIKPASYAPLFLKISAGSLKF